MVSLDGFEVEEGGPHEGRQGEVRRLQVTEKGRIFKKGKTNKYSG